MRILRLTQYVYNPNLEEFRKNKTGYGRSVYEISQFSSKMGNREFLFTFANKNSRFKEDINYLPGKKINYLKHINMNSLYSFFKIIFSLFKFYPGRIREGIAYSVYNLSGGYVKFLISEYKPDIIHIHGVTLATLPFIYNSLKSKVPVVVTLHGTNFEVDISEFEKKFEMKMIEFLNKRRVQITLVGSGIKKEIIKRCEIENESLFLTINDGVDIGKFNYDLNIKELKKKYNVENKKVFIQVASLSENKNQDALIDAVNLLTEKEKSKIKVFLIGEGKIRSKLQDKINRYRLENVVEMVGYQDNSGLSVYYSLADYVMVMSIKEGFGRPIVEAYSFGKPVITFFDIDAVNDLYSKKSMIKIKSREIEEVVRTIRTAMNINFDQEEIKELSVNNSWEKIVQEYNNLYEDVMHRGKPQNE